MKPIALISMLWVSMTQIIQVNGQYRKIYLLIFHQLTFDVLRQTHNRNCMPTTERKLGETCCP